MSVDPVSLAIEAGLMLVQTGLTMSQTIEGPRIKSSPITAADYGTSLNYFRGTRMLTCPCIFAKPIKEVKKKRKTKGGKQVSYTGYGTWAVHVADHAIGGVLQVWFDNHLVYDATGSSEKIYPLADDYELEAHMRVYLGTPDQDPDPDMLAYIEARDGPGTCPAYRDESLLYLENIPLEQLGNRYPDVKVLAYQDSALELAAESEITFVGQMKAGTDGSATGDVAFALTGGSDATPQAGDLVLVVATCTSVSTAGSYNPFPPVGPDYTSLASIDATASFNHVGLGLWGKIMGDTPDAAWSAADSSGGGSHSSAFQVVVFRGVDPDAIVLAEPETWADAHGQDWTPPDILIGDAVFDPGNLHAGATNRVLLAASFALQSAGGQALPMAVGGCSLDTVPGSGNFTSIEYSTDNSARSATALAAWGETVLLGRGATLAAVLTAAAASAGLEPDEYDFGAVATDAYLFDGFNWTQSAGRQIGESLCDLYDVDLRPHDFVLQALPRGGASAGALPHGEFVLDDEGESGSGLGGPGESGGVPYALTDKGDTDLPRRVFVTYADSTAGQTPNVAMPQGQEPAAGGTDREASIDMTTLALAPARMQPLTERWQRRQRFGRWTGSFGLTRQRLAIEPADVHTPSFDGEAMSMRCTKLSLGADGKLASEWERDDPAIAALPNSAGAPAAGYVPEQVPDAVDSLGAVLDVPLLIDAHDQTAPLAYLVAGPAEPGTWAGADFAQSDTGGADSYAQGWDGIGSADGSVIGTCTAGLPDAEPWVPDYGSSLEVTINAGELTAATLDDLLLDGTLNLAAVESGDGWELVQFMTPTLTGELTYTLTGFLRGGRGTEWAMAGHAAGDRFMLLADAKRHTLGASDLGDTDWYVIGTTGQGVDEANAFSVEFTGAAHRPYSPVNGSATLSGGDWSLTATRRTRIGGSSVNGQDVPLGETSESWEADVLDGAEVVRTLAGTSLPLVYTEEQQVIDFGGAQTSLNAVLYQMNPTLTLRGYPLEVAG